MAIEASKFTEKDELIAKFYTLRAGLSVIAEETEKIKAAETGFEQAQKEFDSALQYKKRTVEQCNHSIAQKNSRIAHCKTKKEELQNEKAGWVSYIIGGWLSCIVYGPIASMTNFFNDNEVLTGFFVVLCIIGGALALNKIVTWHKRNNKDSKAQCTKYDDEIATLTKEILNDTQVVTNLIAEIELLEHKNQKTQIEVVQNLLMTESQLKNKVIPQSTAIAQSTRAAMLQTSKGVLNESDWQNIDLLIFYLETGRADSLKEALQLVDKQRQTDQITRAIGEASRHIANVLQAGFNRLASLMNNGFSELGRQIQFNHSETINTMLTSFANLENSISAGNRATQEQLKDLNRTMKVEGERIAKAEQLNASLLRKANESSDDLMNELRYNQKYWKK